MKKIVLLAALMFLLCGELLKGGSVPDQMAWRSDFGTGTSPVALRGGVVLADGVLRYDGKDGHAVIPDSAGWHLGERGLTLVTVVKPLDCGTTGDSSDSLDMYLSKSGEYLLGRYRECLYLNVRNGEEWVGDTLEACQLPVGRWAHVAGVIEPLQTGGYRLAIYFNGRRIVERRFPKMRGTRGDAPVILGKGWGGPWFYHGDMAEAAVYRRALGENEIAALFARCARIAKSISGDSAVEDTGAVPGRIFHVDFENDSGFAAFARGDGRPRVPYTHGKATGFDGKNAYRMVEKGNLLQYGALNNALPTRGTAVIWLKADNFEPSDLRWKLVGNRWNLHSIRLFEIDFQEDSEHWSNLSLNLKRSYDVEGVRLEYDSSGLPHSWGSDPSMPIGLLEIQKGNWYQVACTWDLDRISVYLNGDYRGSSLMCKTKADAIRRLRPQGKRSWIKIRGMHNEQAMARGEILDVDDFSVYDRVLTPAEIHYLHASSVASSPLSPAELVHCGFQGTYRGGKEKVRAVIDFTMLRRLCPALAKKGAQVVCQVFGEDGKQKASAAFLVGTDSVCTLYLDGLTKGGKYRLRLQLPELSLERTFDKPDTSWAESTAGKEDVTPKPWTMPVLAGDAVSVWNRKYQFAGGPFPVKVETPEGSVLARPVELMLRTGSGEIAVFGRVTGREQGGAYVKLRGSLEGGGISGSYETMVDFDGFMQTTIRVDRAVPVSALSLQWQVARPFIGRLFVPAPDLCGGDVREFAYFDNHPLGSVPKGVIYNHPNRRNPCFIHLTSERGGFCWLPAGDDNWVYDEGEKICHVNKKTGECAVKVITRPVTIPQGAVYTFCFIATPTRPLMKNARAWRFNLNQVKQPGDVKLQYHCYQTTGSLLISAKQIRKYTDVPRSLQLYAATEFLRTDNPEAWWFFDDWLTYGYAYGATYSAIPSCLNTARSNFHAENTRKSLDLPEFKYVDGFYFDCCDLNQCDNPLHGCRRTDSFGRQIIGTNLLPLRDFLKRIVRLLHARGRTVGAHQQIAFCPGIHGLCDYWVTGEELRALGLKEGATVYCDTQKIPDDHLRTVENFRYMCNVVACMDVYNNWKLSRHNLPSITRLLLEDIKCVCSMCPMDYERLDKVWRAFATYKVDEGTVHRHFEQTLLRSSVPEVKLTYYQGPDGRLLVIAGNLSKDAQTVSVSGVPLEKAGCVVTDEVGGGSLPTAGGKLTLKVDGRDFRLFGIQ